MKIESKIGKSATGSEKIYNFITDFRNFKNIVPQDKVSNWQADQDSCSFKVDVVGKIKMRIFEKEPCSMVKIISDPAVSQYNFTMWIQIKEVGDTDSRVKITLEPEINKVLIPMVKTPLKQFVDSLIDQIEIFDFGHLN